MKKYLLGIDIGTSSVKAAIYGTDLQLVSKGASEYPTFYPKNGWAEQNPEHWWESSVSAIRMCLKQGAIDAKDIQGICVSSQAPTLAPVDADGNCIRNGLIWMDRRAEGHCDRMKSELGISKVLDITGNRIDPYFVSGKMMWYRDVEPDNYAKTYRILQVNGFVNFRLTGIHSIDKGHACLTGLYDIHMNRWSEMMFERLCLDLNKMAHVYPSMDIIGGVNEYASKLTGLAVGTPVIAGNIDASSSALESGIVGEGKAVDMTGTSTVFMVGSDDWKASENLVSLYNPVNDSSLVAGTISSTGASLKWFKNQLGELESVVSGHLHSDPFDLLAMEAEQVAPGSDRLIFLPYMAGERSPIWDVYARGVFFGLDLNMTKGHMVRAIMEGAAFALKHNMEEAEKMGLKIDSLRAVGGGSNSSLWLKIKASVTHKPIVTLRKASSGAFGDILLAGAGIGVFDDIKKILEDSIAVKELFEPDDKLAAKYDKLYEVYRSIYRNTKQDIKKLAELEDF